MITRIRMLQPLGVPRGRVPTTRVALWWLALLVLSPLLASAVEPLPDRPQALLAAMAVLAPNALTSEPSCLNADVEGYCQVVGAETVTRQQQAISGLDSHWPGP